MSEECAQKNDPLDQAWRVAMRWRPLAAQALSCFVVLAVLAAGITLACPGRSGNEGSVAAGIHTIAGYVSSTMNSGSAGGAHWTPLRVIVLLATLVVTFILVILSASVVMAAASDEGSEGRKCLFNAALRALVPSVAIGLCCSVIVLALSTVFHVVPAMLARAEGSVDWLGQLIFAAAIVPIMLVALVELILVLAAIFVFTPVLVDEKAGLVRAFQLYFDTLVGCHRRDICERLRAFVMACLIALPILLALGICAALTFGTAKALGVDLLRLYDFGNYWLVALVMWMSTLLVVAVAAAAPRAYLNAACLLIHRAARS